MPGERGPLASPHARRRNKRTVAGVLKAGTPSMPATLTPEAKREWRRVAPALADMGILASIDRGVLIRYCTAWAEWVELDEQIRTAGRLVRGQGGTWVRTPLWLLRRDAASEATELGRQLNLTPVARLRAGMVHERGEGAVPSDDPKVALMQGYRDRLG